LQGYYDLVEIIEAVAFVDGENGSRRPFRHGIQKLAIAQI
jgi:hypothetical protein